MEKIDGQKESGILNPSDKPEKTLNPEEERIIRRFIWGYITIPGVFAGIVCFVLGILIEKAAYQNASNQAFQSSVSEIFRVIREVDAAKLRADSAARSVQASSEEISKTEARAKVFVDRVAAVENELRSTEAFKTSDLQIKKIAEVLAHDPRITKVQADLDGSIKARFNKVDTAIRDRLDKADQEIKGIKGFYAIDFREGLFTGVVPNYSSGAEVREKFTFPFAVKNAWIEIAQRLHGVNSLVVTEINGNSVTVELKATRPLRFDEMRRGNGSPSRLNPEDYRFRVWGTSF